jgi:PAS domain S-box-containing protein
MGPRIRSIVGRRASEVFPHAIPRHLRRFARVVAKQTSDSFDTLSDIVGRHLSVVCFPAGGDRFATLVQDITESMRAQAALRESEERYRLMADAVPHLAWRCDPEGLTIDCNDRWYAYTGQTPEQARGNGWMRALHPDDRGRVMQRVKDDVAGGEVYQTEYRLLRASDGSYRWHLARALPVRDTSNRILGWFGSAADIEDQKQAQEALRQTNEQLEGKVGERTAVLHQRSQQLVQLAAELTHAEHKERRRIAQILHDDLQQRLAGILYKIQSARVDHGKKISIRKTLDEAIKSLRWSIARTRNLTTSLCPPTLYEFGLRSGLEWLAREVKTQFGLSVRVSGLKSFTLPSDEIRSFAFDAVRELLMNVRKHAGVKSAEIRIRSAGQHRIAVEIRDKGKGCAMIGGNGSTFGLFSIRERASAFGVEFAITSAPRKGTCATLTLPIV